MGSLLAGATLASSIRFLVALAGCSALFQAGAIILGIFILEAAAAFRNP
jgi:hypothetical protein